MAKFKIGDKVRFVDEEGHKKYQYCYPPVGTVGEITRIDRGKFLRVQWPHGSTSFDDSWYCEEQRLEIVTEGGISDA